MLQKYRMMTSFGEWHTCLVYSAGDMACSRFGAALLGRRPDATAEIFALKFQRVYTIPSDFQPQGFGT